MRADKVIIFSDMDGTMLTDWSFGPVVPAVNLEAIKRFISEGGLFSIASGRQFGETLAFFDGIKFPIPTVQGNGSVIFDSESGEVVKKIALPEQVKLECLEYSQRKKGIWLIAADEFDIYQVSSGDAEWDAALTDVRRIQITTEEYKALEAVKTCFVIADKAELPSVARDISSFSNADMFHIMQSSPVFLEVLEKSASKALAVKEVIKLAKAENRKLVCIGDYDNDCDMLALADIAACPSNSSSRVLEMADIITCSNNEGAIADLISKLQEL